MKNNIYVSSLCNVELINKRRSGNTTRIVSNIIDLLFKGHSVSIEDHSNNQMFRTKQMLFKRVKYRLKEEHYISEEELDVTKKNIDNGIILIISLK